MQDEFAGPRKLRYFTILIQILVVSLVIGAILAEFYGVTLLETVTMFFAENHRILFELAGFLALIVGIGKAVKFFNEFVD